VTVILALMSGATLLTVLIAVACHVLRQYADRRRARLSAVPRRALVSLVADEHASEAQLDLLAGLPAGVWRAVAPTAIGMLAKLRGDARVALAAVFERRGMVSQALRDLATGSPIRRGRAAVLLGSLARHDAVPGLCALLDDRHREVRLAAVRALALIGDVSAAQPLLASVIGRRPTPPQLIADALAKLGPAVLPSLLDALRDPRPPVRLSAVNAIHQLGATGARTSLVAALRTDESVEVRRLAARALGRLGTRSALAPLIDATGPDQPLPVRAEATLAIGEWASADAVDVLGSLLADDHYPVAHAAARALLRTGPAGLATLRRAAAAPDTTAQAHATEALTLAGHQPDHGFAATGHAS